MKQGQKNCNQEDFSIAQVEGDIFKTLKGMTHSGRHTQKLTNCAAPSCQGQHTVDDERSFDVDCVCVSSRSWWKLSSQKCELLGLD